MYKSPIEIIYGDIEKKIEGDVFQIIQHYGISVDKDELLPALRYDREQYEKGYADAMAELVRCKECIGKAHWYKNDYGCTICGLSGLFVTKDSDFCPYGERREEE